MPLCDTAAKKDYRTKMTISRRASLIILLAGLFLILGLLFSRFVVDNVVMPVALVLWLIWRFIRSVDQTLYWSLLIFSALGYALICFVRRTEAPPAFEQTQPSDLDVTREHIHYWTTSIQLTREQRGKINLLKRNLGEMLATMYAEKQSEVAPFEFYAALKRGQIPLPENIHAFLFPAEPSGGGRSFRQILHTIRQIPGNHIRRWTGRDVDEYYHSIEAVILFMESAMETKHDDKQFDTHHY